MSATLLNRFGNLLAPQPKIHVFQDIEGDAYAVVRDPFTRQPIVGLSGNLFRKLRNTLLEEQNRQIANEFMVTYVQGQVETIPFYFPKGPIGAPVESLPDVAVQTLELRPTKP